MSRYCSPRGGGKALSQITKDVRRAFKGSMPNEDWIGNFMPWPVF